MGRVFICGFLDFPHGTAPANYVQYMALALSGAGYEVHLLTNINHGELGKSSFFEKHQGIVCHEISLSCGRIQHWVEFNILLGCIFSNIIKSVSLGREDIIISYSSEYLVNRSILTLSQKYKNRCIVCVTELFGWEDLRQLGRRGRSYQKSYKIYDAYDMVFAISHYIERCFQSKTQTVYLPILSDPFEYPYVDKKHNGITKVIYMKKWAEPYQRVIQAIGKMSSAQLKNIEFHLCGFNEEEIAQLIPFTYKKNTMKFIFHKKMDYAQLISLYDEMHFMLLIREESLTTKANFPSKIVEAMGRGVIPVVTNVGDYVTDYLEDRRNSHIIASATEESIVRGICYINSQDSSNILRMSQMARETCVEELHYKKWSKVLSDILQGGQK